MRGVAMAPPGARFHGTLPNLGAPIHTAEYPDGFKSCAYAHKADPTVGQDAHRIYLIWQWDPATQQYVQLALPDSPRPLYRAENLTNHPTWPVYVFEREDMVDAFHSLSGEAEVIATTVPGGCTQFDRGSWDELYGRAVVLVPTNTPESLAGMHQLGAQLQKEGSRVSLISIPQDKEAGWSFLQVIDASWSWEQWESYAEANRQTSLAPVVAIRPARARPPTVAAPVVPANTSSQPTPQIQGFRNAWQRIPGLTFAPSGTPYANLYNIEKTIEAWKGGYGKFWYDEFHGRVMTSEGAGEHGREWEEIDTLKLCSFLQGSLGFAGVRPPTVADAVTIVAQQDRRHEVREWLQSLEWDQSTRLHSMLHRGWGAAATPYVMAVSKSFLIAAVARIFQPGCQVDYVPVFQGPGGVGKTSALRELFGHQWFDNPSAMMGDKDFLQNMRGKWCLELGELANIRGRANEIVKSIITRRVDLYRDPYGRAPASYKRQCIFAGTIDRGGWNTDEAGGRRWWPIMCTRIDLAWISENRAQLFAEAVHYYKRGDKWWEVSLQDARQHQKDAQVHDVFEDLLDRNIVNKQPPSKQVTMEEALHAVGLDDTRSWDDRAQGRVVKAMRVLGWHWDVRAKVWLNPDVTE